MKFAIYLLILVIPFIVSCKHDHAKPSPTLEKAFSIQKEGIKELKQIEVLIAKMSAGDKEQFGQKKALWQTNMLEIEGMEHDHSQCSGDHSKKRFTISDQDMLAAQTEWRDSILSLKKQIMRIGD